MFIIQLKVGTTTKRKIALFLMETVTITTLLTHLSYMIHLAICIPDDFSGSTKFVHSISYNRRTNSDFFPQTIYRLTSYLRIGISYQNYQRDEFSFAIEFVKIGTKKYAERGLNVKTCQNKSAQKTTG